MLHLDLKPRLTFVVLGFDYGYDVSMVEPMNGCSFSLDSLHHSMNKRIVVVDKRRTSIEAPTHLKTIKDDNYIKTNDGEDPISGGWKRKIFV